MKIVWKLALFIVAISCLYSLKVVTQSTNMAQRPEVQAFITEMAHKYNFNREQLNTLFSQIKTNEEVMAKITKPYEAKPWYIYRDFFLKPERIQKGVAYWKTHENTLDLAHKKYGIPPEIIVAIIGVESLYGEDKGKFPVLSTLATLSFENYRRNKFFKDELKQFLLLTRENKLNPLQVNGSYAGAMGLPQFMPSSYREYAVDFNQKGYSDLMNSHEDAITSVANYLLKHGWTAGEPIVYQATVTGEKYASLSPKNLKPNLNKADLEKYGITSATPIHNNQLVAFIKLQGKNADEYWVGLQNFYVISTYNKSNQYVMVVNLLAEKIAQLHSQQ